MKKLLAPLLILASSLAAGQTVGIDIGSIHVPKRAGQENFNPGVYYVSEDGLTAGIYQNTIKRTSLLLGITLEHGPWDLMVGVVSGYQRKTFIGVCDDGVKIGNPHNPCYRGNSPGFFSPAVSAGYRIPIEVLGVSPRVSVVPGFRGSSWCLHGSVEKPF